MKKVRIIPILFLLLFAFGGLVFPVSAGTAESFATSPLPYWDDNSVNMGLSWQSGAQTVTIANDTPAWFDYDWTKRKAISLDGSTGAGTNYQVRVNVVFDTDMQTDFDDLRFTDDDAVSQLHYWRQSYVASTSAIFWVEVADDLGSDRTIYMYYGNGVVSTTSSATATWLLYDDFNDASLNTTLWDVVTGTPVESGGVLTCTGTARESIASDAHYTYGRILTYARLNYAPAGTYSGKLGFLHEWTGSDTGSTSFWVYDASSTRARTTTASVTVGDFDGAYHLWEIRWTSGRAEYYIDDVWEHTNTTGVHSSTSHPSFYAHRSDGASIADWVAVGKAVYPDISVTFEDESVYVSTLDVGVPIKAGSTQFINTRINVTDLETSVRFEFGDNDTASGLYVIVDNETVTFPDARTSNVPSNGVVTFEFSVMEVLSRYAIRLYDSRRSLLGAYTEYEGRGFNTWLNITGSGFSGSLLMYYLTGDVYYVEVYTYPEIVWTRTGDWDSNVEGNLLGYQMNTENTAVEYNVTYTLNSSYFVFLRTEFSNYILAAPVDLNWTIGIGVKIEVGDYSIEFTYNETYYGAASYTMVRVSNSTDVQYFVEVAKNPWLINDYLESVGKIMIWRTQENSVGLMYWGDYYCPGASGESTLKHFWTEGYTTGGLPYGSWSLAAGVNESLWISDFVIDDWSSVDVSINYWMIEPNSGDDVLTEFRFNYFEYLYGVNRGVVQPHFSTTWWEGGVEFVGVTPRYGETRYYGDPFTQDDNPEVPFPPWDEQIPDFWTDPVGWLMYFGNEWIRGIAWVLMQPLIAIVIPVLEIAFEYSVGAITYLLNTVGDAVLGNPTLGTDLVGFLGGIFSLVSSFFTFGTFFLSAFGQWVITFGTWLTWVGSVLVKVTPYVPLVAGVHIGMAYLKTLESDDWSYFMGAIQFWVGIVMWVFNTMIMLVGKVFDWVVNLIPFT